MSNKSIGKGDHVRVYFAHHEPINGIVQSTPAATGDTWAIVRPAVEWSDEKIYAVQQFDYMELLP